MHVNQITLEAPKAAEANLHLLFISDVSGSMHGELPRIREQLKDQIAKVLRRGDRVSIIGFSGKGQVYDVSINTDVHDLKSFRTLEQHIDSELVTRGLTGFKDPLERATELCRNSTLEVAAVFLTDGMDNQNSRDKILQAARGLGAVAGSVQVVEYGNYCDRQLLAELAAETGGSLSFSERWGALSEAITRAMRDAPRGRRIEVAVPQNSALVWTIESDQITVHQPENGVVRVQEGAGTVYVAENGGQTPASSEEAGYALIAVGAQRRDGDLMEAGLRLTGDVALIRQYGSAYGPQPLADLAEAARTALLDPSARLREGYDPNMVPQEDAFTVIELMDVLRSGDNRFLPDHPEFRYNRTGRATVERGDDFGAHELELLRQKAEKAKEEGPEAVAKITEEIEQTMEAKAAKPRFTLTPAPEGYPISKLTGHASRANISTLLLKAGTLELTGTLPGDVHVPRTYQTQVWRNLSVLVDGRYNVDVLPVKLDDATDEALRARGILSAPKGEVQLINIRNLPVVNRQMVRGVTGRELAEIEVEALELRARLKVLNYAWDENFPPETSENMAEAYGQRGAQFLRSVGLTDSGYSPRSDLAEATDEYTGSEVKVSVKGYSTLPKLSDVINGMVSGKLNAPGKLMARTQSELEAYLASIGDMEIKASGEALRAWLRNEIDRAEQRLASLRERGARLRFAILVGFAPLSDLQDGSVTVRRGETEYPVKIEVVTKTHKI